MSNDNHCIEVGVNARTFSVEEPEGEVQCGIEMVRQLARLPGIDVTLFAHSHDLPALDAETVVTDRIPGGQPSGLVWEQLVLPRLVKRADVDVLFCPTSNPPLRRVEPPVVTWIHDVFGYLGYVSRAYAALQRVRMPRIVSVSDYIATVSEYSRRSISDEFGIPAADIDVVPNGVDSDFFEEGGRGALDLPPDYVLYVGGLHGRKNVKGVIAAVERLRDVGVETELVLVGPGEKAYYQSSEVTIDQPHVHHYGFVSKTDLIQAFDEASVFVFPSLFEGFGVPPLEAMARGTPVVSSDRTSLPEVLGDGALLVDPTDTEAIADAIRRILDDPALARELSAAGRRQAQRYRWEESASKMAALLREVATT